MHSLTNAVLCNAKIFMCAQRIQFLYLRVIVCCKISSSLSLRSLTLKALHSWPCEMLGVGLVLEQPCAIRPPNVAPAMLAQTTRAFGVPTTLTSCCISRSTGRVATPAPCAATPSSAPDALPPWPSSSGSSGLLKRPVRPEQPEPSSSSVAGDSGVAGTKASGGGRSRGSRRSNYRRTSMQRPSRTSPAPVSQRCVCSISNAIGAAAALVGCCTSWRFTAQTHFPCTPSPVTAASRRR